MALSDSFQPVVGRPPLADIAFDATTAPDRACKEKCRRLADAGCSPQMEAAALSVDQVEQRSGKRCRDCQHKARVASSILGHMLLPVGQCALDVEGVFETAFRL